jgi:cation transport regulator ChaC
MAQSTVWYFAYASNMSKAQVKSRIGADPAEERVARLDNYELVFNKRSRGGTATANIRQAQGELVEGVLYRLPESALRSLDRYEGAPVHYRRIEVTVVDQAGRKTNAQVFIATKVDKGRLRPAPHYLQTILEGASEHSLPTEYIDKIKAAAQG